MGGYVEFVVEALGALGEISSRRMFGGHCLYCEGIPFALIAADTLYLKVDAGNEGDFEAAGLEAFRPFDDKPQMVMSYRLAPPEIFEDAEALEKWGGGAVAAARRARAAMRPRKRRGRRTGARAAGDRPAGQGR